MITEEEIVISMKRAVETIKNQQNQIERLKSELSKSTEEKAKAFDEGATEIRKMIAIGFRDNKDKAERESDKQVFEAIADTMPTFPLPFNPYREANEIKP